MKVKLLEEKSVYCISGWIILHKAAESFSIEVYITKCCSTIMHLLDRQLCRLFMQKIMYSVSGWSENQRCQ